jgi:hypothetical protein
VNIINGTVCSLPIGFGFPHIRRKEERGEKREKREYLYYFMVHLFPLSPIVFPSYTKSGSHRLTMIITSNACGFPPSRE